MSLERILFFSLLIFVASCDNSENQEDKALTDLENESHPTMTEEKIRRHVEGQLSILPTEQYSIEQYKEHLDTDDSVDVVITVNLLSRALKEAEVENVVSRREQLGYMGNYNFIFYVDGKTKTITSPIAVPSSPHVPLKVSFASLTSTVHKDLIVDFRIRRSSYRQFYTIRERAPIKVSESELFENLGTNDFKPYYVEIEDWENEVWKSISVYEGKAENKLVPELRDSYQFQPDIKRSDKLIRRWYYSPKHLKYYLRKDEI